MSGGIHAEALERYERQAAALRANLARVVHGWDAVPLQQAYFPLLRKIAAEKRAAEEQDRREWIDGVRRRLGLVTEAHRCRVWKRGEGDWARRCLRPGCPAGRPLGWAPSQEHALGDALAHAGAFLPLPPEEETDGELDWDWYVPLLDALPWRAAGGG